jgi:hypothetical protein
VKQGNKLRAAWLSVPKAAWSLHRYPDYRTVTAFQVWTKQDSP